MTLDEVFYMSGDEDGGVGLQCRICDRGGAPVVYYTSSDDGSYRGTDVVIVHSITDLISGGASHVAIHDPSTTSFISHIRK